jgi:glycosyltransferase involved in cell wall biosynthesis
VNGILVPVKDIQALYFAMNYYIQNREKINEHGNNSRMFAEQKYDVYKKAKAIENRISLFYINK